MGAHTVLTQGSIAYMYCLRHVHLYHRVGRVLSFSPVVGIGTPPTPHPGGGAHSLAREGVGESQFRRGDIHFGTLYIHVRTL